jgi:putative ABC transport system permease protein
MEVIGVIADVKHELNLPVTPEYYLPHAQDSWNAMVLVAKTSVDPASLAGPLRKQVWSIDKDQPVFDVKTMQEVRSGSVAVYSFSSVMLGIFAFVALLLASIGIYGVMAFAVTQRTQEIGIRIALGARGTDIVTTFLRQSLWLSGVGVAVGVIAAAVAAPYLESLLFGLNPRDPAVFVVVATAFPVVAMVAAYVPARRATSIDPVAVLRGE